MCEIIPKIKGNVVKATKWSMACMENMARKEEILLTTWEVCIFVSGRYGSVYHLAQI